MPANHIATWNGSTWVATAVGTSASVFTALRMPGGDLVVGGWFRSIAGVPANAIARWNGSAWSPLGSGIDNQVLAMTALPNGDLVVGGGFARAGSGAASNIARWDGTTWSPLGVGFDNAVEALGTMPNGDVVAAGWFNASGGQPMRGLARWNGTAWAPVGGGLSSSIFVSTYALGLAVMPNGDLVVAGSFQFAGGVPVQNIARWNGTTWSAITPGLGAGFGAPYSLTMLPLGNGDLIVAGGFQVATTTGVANNIARWNGTAWSPLGTGLSGTAAALTVLANGDLGVGGSFATAGGVAVNNLARWNGSSWSGLAGGTFGSQTQFAGVSAMATAADGDLWIGGDFSLVGNLVSMHVARLTTTCPAQALPAGAGCAGAGGAPVLAATALPWLGATCRTSGTGLPASALVAAITGLNPWSLALAFVFPQALPGCTLHATPDAIVIGNAAGGRFDYAFGIPNTPALVGVSVFHQMVVQELGPQQQLLAMTATNALQLTVGAF